jgi:hypothetical protein
MIMCCLSTIFQMTEKAKGIKWEPVYHDYNLSWCTKCRPDLEKALSDSVYVPVSVNYCDNFYHAHPHKPVFMKLYSKIGHSNYAGNPTIWKLTNQSRMSLLRRENVVNG